MKRLFHLCLMLILASPVCAAEYRIETVADGLSRPWAIAFLPGGDMLVSERSGRLRRISDGQLEAGSIGNLPELYVGGQGGLLDIVLDPGFATNQTLYLSYSSGDRSANSTSVVSAKLDGKSLAAVRNIFTAKPDKDTPHHFGGRMALMPDKTLLITVGEGFDYREQAQSLDSHLGKVIRINTDGSVPADNPFVAREDARPEIWTWGHRNPQGILVSADGTVWLHEHGPRGGDELNLLEPEKNYGWPAITFGMDYSGAYVSPFTEAEGMEQPIIHWTPSIAPAGFCEYQGSAFPEWRGDLFVAALAERSVRRLVMENHSVASQEILFTELGERMRDVRQGPDGFLYLLTDSDEGRVLRVLPAR